MHQSAGEHGGQNILERTRAIIPCLLHCRHEHVLQSHHQSDPADSRVNLIDKMKLGVCSRGAMKNLTSSVHNGPSSAVTEKIEHLQADPHVTRGGGSTSFHLLLSKGRSWFNSELVGRPTESARPNL